jgi:eukaryotic-like serine/threonine-protein kinase
MTATPDFDGCQVIKRLHQGPIADVYHAIQQPLGRPVLIKALSSSILPSSPFAATLEREARLLAELHHPNILHIHDFVRRGDRMWLVLEFVDGWTLEDLLEKQIELAPEAAAAIALEVARALEHAHQHAVIHRDIRPSNIVISRKGGVKLVNFAVAVDERLPTAPELLDGATAIGGPAYMSPEQILGEPPDPRSDLFSLGSVIYELVSQRRPFPDDGSRSATQRIRHDPPIPLSRLVPSVPAPLERIVQRCLAKLPSDRFGSSAELVQALRQVVREAGGKSAQQVIGRALLAARLTDHAPPAEAEPKISRGPKLRSAGVGPAVRGLLVAFGLVVFGGGVIQYMARQGGAQPHTRRTQTRLELVPQPMGHLRVVATPWAHVSVDGQRVATTPFAHPIPLEAGVHYVRLEHPNAPVERRTVDLVAGETVLLDVKMDIAPEAIFAAEAALAPEAASATPAASVDNSP